MEDDFEKKMTYKKRPRTSMDATYGALKFHVLLEVTCGALHVPLEVTYEALHYVLLKASDGALYVHLEATYGGLHLYF